MSTQYSKENHPHFILEKNVDIPMRDSAILKADVFRPTTDGKYPAILNLGPYQKDKLWTTPPTLEEKGNPFMNWETVNPEIWMPEGYVSVRVDARGSGKSPGQYDPWSFAEAVDFYDAIEWAAKQPWCNGNVGLLGISYYAINQWFVANLQPPSLKAIIPWEGFADLYRDGLYHGGILNVFMTNWFTAHLLHHNLGRASQTVPNPWERNTLSFWLGNNLDTGAFRGSQADWSKINIPFYSVGNWTGMGLHLRGNTEAFMLSPSKNKKLRMQNGSHVHPFYTAEGRKDQMRFFDYWLKGIDNGIMQEPPVKLAIRYGNDEIQWRHENEWPLARTQWTKWYIDVQETAKQNGPYTASISAKNPEKEAVCTYAATGFGSMGSTSAASSQVMGGGIKPDMGVAFYTEPMTEDVEITGPLSASLWVSSSSEDMDIFITIRHYDESGNEIMDTGQQGTPVPVAKGWLRVSHRELDEKKSLPYRPYHQHQRRLRLTPGEIVQVQVEIWPTSMVFRKGHKMRVDIQPRDGVGSAGYLHYHADYNTGTNTIHTGGQYESYLLLPIIPKEK
jgi:predicted acyl esterase